MRKTYYRGSMAYPGLSLKDLEDVETEVEPKVEIPAATTDIRGEESL